MYLTQKIDHLSILFIIFSQILMYQYGEKVMQGALANRQAYSNIQALKMKHVRFTCHLVLLNFELLLSNLVLLMITTLKIISHLLQIYSLLLKIYYLIIHICLQLKLPLCQLLDLFKFNNRLLGIKIQLMSLLSYKKKIVHLF